MEVIAFILLTLFIAIVIIVNAFYRSAKKNTKQHSYVLPELGMQGHSEAFKFEMQNIIRHLEQSLPENYVERVKERVIREHRISMTEWDNRWFEWKRFLVMTSILKSVPMYSREVDEIWHEMLIFTREYEDFSQRFLYTMLHHAPNPSHLSFDRYERAWFDVIYVLLFKPTKYSILSWGPFLEQPLSSELLQDFKYLSANQLAAKYFNEYTQKHIPASTNLVLFIVNYIKQKLIELEQHIAQKGTSIKAFRMSYTKSVPETDQALTWFSGILFLSIYYEDQFKYYRDSFFNIKPINTRAL